VLTEAMACVQLQPLLCVYLHLLVVWWYCWQAAVPRVAAAGEKSGPAIEKHQLMIRA
jgi:hypothetical protein